MKIAIITAYLNYDWDIRIKYIKRYLEKYGHSVYIISADFDHRNKSYYQSDKAKMIHVPSYRKNISIRRIYSHLSFSKNAVKEVMGVEPQLLYVITPPNFLFFYLKKVKNFLPGIKIIAEIEDLWPESLPVDKPFKFVMSPLLRIWANIRDKNISCIDSVVYECKLFRDYICNRGFSGINGGTIYLTREDTLENPVDRSIADKTFDVLYLGSVNNLIDIELISNILKHLSEKRKIRFHIIGDGEKVKILEGNCIDNGVECINHKAIYDPVKKEEIITGCHFALNIMKESTFVGMTMKSLEYFHYGVPLINSIGGDTAEIISRYGCGINLNISNYKERLTEILSVSNEYYRSMRNASREVYQEFFSVASFEKSFHQLITSMDLEL